MVANFNTPSTVDATWRVVDGESTWTCATSGLTFVRKLQEVIRQNLTNNGTSYDGHSVSASGVDVDGKWGPATQRGLYNLLVQDNANSTLKSGVQSEGVLHTPRYWSVAAAVWVLLQHGYSPTGGTVPVENIRLDRDLIPPVWDVAPPAPPGWSAMDSIGCGMEVPGTPSTPSTPSVPATNPTDLPTGVVAPPVVAEGGVPWGIIILAGIVVLVVALTATGAMSGGSSVRSRGRRSRRSRRSRSRGLARSSS